MRFASFSGLLALCLLFGNSCSKGVSRARSVTLFFVKGDVVFGSTERNQFQPVTSKSKIGGGDTVRTSEGASINLALLRCICWIKPPAGKTAAYFRDYHPSPNARLLRPVLKIVCSRATNLG